MKALEKVAVTGSIEEYLHSSFRAIRFGSAFCLRYAKERWTPEAVKDAAARIAKAGKTPEFQTLLTPSSWEHIQYIQACIAALESLANPPKLVIGDIGVLTVPYRGEKIASHFLKITSEPDLSLLADFGVEAVGIEPDLQSGRIDAFVAAAHRHGLKVELAVGNPPAFLGWKCYFDVLCAGENCGTACEKTIVPLFSPSEGEPVFYIRGKTMYIAKTSGTKETGENSADSIVLYP